MEFSTAQILSIVFNSIYILAIMGYMLGSSCLQSKVFRDSGELHIKIEFDDFSLRTEIRENKNPVFNFEWQDLEGSFELFVGWNDSCSIDSFEFDTLSIKSITYLYTINSFPIYFDIRI